MPSFLIGMVEYFCYFSDTYVFYKIKGGLSADVVFFTLH